MLRLAWWRWCRRRAGWRTFVQHHPDGTVSYMALRGPRSAADPIVASLGWQEEL